MRVLFLFGTVVIGCLDPDAALTYHQDSSKQGIVNPVGVAYAYPESVTISFPGAECSGAAIAPRVVLTAGHCVVYGGPWTVTTPYIGFQTRQAYRAWTLYVDTGQSVNPNVPDIGLILFDRNQSFSISTWPVIQQVIVVDGTQAFNIGRKNNGYLSNTDLYIGRTISLYRSSSFPYSYESSLVIESGDSGGPVMLEQAHTIVAVNSGAGSTSQVLARTDTVIAHINAQVQANGGWGAETCADLHRNCIYWTAIGECSRNPNYMLTNCCLSCSGSTTCSDRNPNCTSWASNGECSRNPDYMLVYCCKACGLRDPRCTNTDRSCSYWASIGECRNNAAFMTTNCCLSCLGI